MIKIPNAALEAGARAVFKAWNRQPWELTDVTSKDQSFLEARAAFEAMIKAWEGVLVVSAEDAEHVGAHIILPITENPND